MDVNSGKCLSNLKLNPKLGRKQTMTVQGTTLHFKTKTKASSRDLSEAGQLLRATFLIREQLFVHGSVVSLAGC